jgi:DsbC/DsbD-like thiol-disulfide interchange protein
MRVTACLLVLLAAPMLFAQDDAGVTVQPVVESEAEPGQDFTLKLRFTVPDGYHAYHRDNPGFNGPILVKWSELSGLELTGEQWPEPHKKKEEWGEEWELSGIFDIAYTFKVPADATGELAVSGSHESQYCDDDGCYPSEGEFSTTVTVARTGEPEPEVPEIKTSLAFTGPASPGGEATLAWTFEVTKGYHLYHKDNPGYGMAPAFDWSELSGLVLKEEKWPEPVKHKIEADWIEWEYPDRVTIEFLFTVPMDARGELSVTAGWTAQVCDPEVCFDRKGKASASLTIRAEPEKEPAGKKNDARDDHGFYLDFDFALEEARRQNKLLLADFNGRY